MPFHTRLKIGRPNRKKKRISSLARNCVFTLILSIDASDGAVVTLNICSYSALKKHLHS